MHPNRSNQNKSSARRSSLPTKALPYLCRRGPIPFHFLRVIRPTRRARRARHLPTTARHVSSSKDLLHRRHIRRRRRHHHHRRRRHLTRRRGSLFKSFDGVSSDDACDRSRRSSEHARLCAGPVGSDRRRRRRKNTTNNAFGGKFNFDELFWFVNRQNGSDSSRFRMVRCFFSKGCSDLGDISDDARASDGLKQARKEYV